jgi:hypothetical protein
MRSIPPGILGIYARGNHGHVLAGVQGTLLAEQAFIILAMFMPREQWALLGASLGVTKSATFGDTPDCLGDLGKSPGGDLRSWLGRGILLGMLRDEGGGDRPNPGVVLSSPYRFAAVIWRPIFSGEWRTLGTANGLGFMQQQGCGCGTGKDRQRPVTPCE